MVKNIARKNDMIETGRSAPSEPARRSGKLFRVSLYALLFLAAFLAFDRSSFFCLRRAAARYYASLRTTNAPLLTKDAIFGKGDGDFLIFGTSRTRHALNQSTLSTLLDKRVIKESQAGRFPEFWCSFYQEFRKTYPRPKAALFGMDYFMFEKRTARVELARLGLGGGADGLNPKGRVNEASPFLSRISWLFRMKPEIDDYLAEAMKLKQDSPNDEEVLRDHPRHKDLRHIKKPKGHPGNKTRKARLGRKKARGRQITKTMVTRPDRWEKRPYRPFPGVEGAYLEKLIALMVKDGMPVFLLIIPDYIGTNETNFEQDEFKADIRSLAARHKNVFILDFNRPDQFPLEDPAYFGDGAWGKSNCHLSSVGEKEFSRKVAKEVRRILSQGKAREAQGSEEKP